MAPSREKQRLDDDRDGWGFEGKPSLKNSHLQCGPIDKIELGKNEVNWLICGVTRVSETADAQTTKRSRLNSKTGIPLKWNKIKVNK